jgi:hypothetical protein
MTKSVSLKLRRLEAIKIMFKNGFWKLKKTASESQRPIGFFLFRDVIAFYS